MLLAMSAMVIAVYVVKDEFAVPFALVVADGAKHFVIGIILRERTFYHFIARPGGPNIQTPSIFRVAIDRLLTRTVQVHLKSRTQRYALCIDYIDPTRCVGIFLAEPLSLRELHYLRHLRPKIVPVVNSGRNDRPIAFFQRPNIRTAAVRLDILHSLPPCMQLIFLCSRHILT